MKVCEVTSYIEKIAPLNYAEDFDNTGLLIGNYNTEVTGILVTLDTLEDTIDEAIEKNCNLIISFHPIIFKGLKKINGNTYVERVVLKAIQNNICIYATHTALDNSKVGVSAKMCEKLGIENPEILIPKNKIIKKLTTYIPSENAEALRTKLFEVGAGSLGNYNECSFNTIGTGTFRGNENSNPTIGKPGVISYEQETSIHVIFESKNEKAIIKALLENHPYEEVAYEIITLDNSNAYVGMGMIGNLSEAVSEDEFLKLVKKTFKTDCVRHSERLNKKIQRIALLGGSGSFAIDNAIHQKADAYISADFKYHDFFRAEKRIFLADIGHYESEQFTKNLLYDYLNEKFTNFAVVLSEKSTNPIYYF